MGWPYLLKRRAAWYLRVRVPSDLSPLLGVHLTRTLGTRDHLVPHRRALRAVGRLDGFWSEARSIVNELWMGRPISEVTDEDIVAAPLPGSRPPTAALTRKRG